MLLHVYMYVHCVAVMKKGDVQLFRSILQAVEHVSREVVTNMATEIDKKPDNVNSKCLRHQ